MIRFTWLQFRAQAMVGLRRRWRSSPSSWRSPARTSSTSTTRQSADCKPARRLLGGHERVPQPDTALCGSLGRSSSSSSPALIGMFWGAPLVARELETGTFRLAWTQSVTRTRWLAVKLGVVGLASMAVGRAAQPDGDLVVQPDRPGQHGPAQPSFDSARHRPDRLRRLRLRPRRHRRDADPPHGARDGRHPGRLRCRSGRHAPVDTAPPLLSGPHHPRRSTSNYSRKRGWTGPGRLQVI